jgi:tetratricopeptide (TPR) repeat protein
LEEARQQVCIESCREIIFARHEHTLSDVDPTNVRHVDGAIQDYHMTITNGHRLMYPAIVGLAVFLISDLYTGRASTGLWLNQANVLFTKYELGPAASQPNLLKGTSEIPERLSKIGRCRRCELRAAQLYFYMGKYDLARDVFLRAKTPARAYGQDGVTWLLANAGKSLECKRYDQAQAAYRLVIEVSDTPSKGFYGLGDVAWRRNDPKTARRMYRAGIGSDVADAATGYFLLGQMEFGLKRDEDALRALLAALQIHSKGGETSWVRLVAAYNLLGQIYGRHGDLDHALQFYRAAISSDPNASAGCDWCVFGAYQSAGQILASRADWDGAVQAFRGALVVARRDEWAFDARLSLVRALRGKGDVQASNQMLEAAALQVVAEPTAYLSLGDAYREAGNKERALQYYDRALTLDAKNREVMARLKEIQEDRR